MKQPAHITNYSALFSRFIILLPVAVIVIALFLKITSPATLSSKQAPTPTIVQPSLTTSQSNIPTAVPSQPQIKLDLTGPYKCQVVEATSSATLYIKNKQIYSELNQTNKKEHVLLNGDCLYKWENFQGDKTCGMSDILSMYDTFAGMGVLSFDTLVGMANGAGLSDASGEAKMRELAQSCKKIDFSNSVFTIPTGVNFKESDLPNSFGSFSP